MDELHKLIIDIDNKLKELDIMEYNKELANDLYGNNIYKQMRKSLLDSKNTIQILLNTQENTNL